MVVRQGQATVFIGRASGGSPLNGIRLVGIEIAIDLDLHRVGHILQLGRIVVFNFLVDGQLPIRNGLEVEADFEVGSAFAAFHIEDLDAVVGTIGKGVAVPVHAVLLTGRFILRFDGRAVPNGRIRFRCITADRRIRVADFTCCEVDGAALRIVDAAEVKDKHAIDVNPHIIVAGELEDHWVGFFAVVTFHLTPLRLVEIRPDVHTKVEIGILVQPIDRIIKTGIILSEFFTF